MKFFFADCNDSVDPDYNFIADSSRPGRNRSRDHYAHEFFENPPYDGLLVSRTMIENSSGRYTQSQKFRILREGIRQQLRYPCEGYTGNSIDYPIMGDCGSFSYVEKVKPPFGARDTANFYETCGFTYGVSPDHIITTLNPRWDDIRRLPSDVQARWDFTYRTAAEFLAITDELGRPFHPVGVVQCWSPKSAASHAKKLVDLGYDYIGIGGIASRRTHEIYDILCAVREAIPDDVRVHLFGFNRVDQIHGFQGIGISSIDSTAPLLKSFKDDEFNYFHPSKRHYLGVRVPPLVETSVKNRIRSGQIDGDRARILEEASLRSLRAYARRESDVDETVETVVEYESYVTTSSPDRDAYRRVLEDRYWEECECPICREIGIEVIIYRGLNRNKRRGFHNLHVFYERIKKAREMKSLELPCIRIQQSKDRHIFSFAANGKEISKFASVSRIGRAEDGALSGYQRPEIQGHISEIQSYFEKQHAILPNALVVAFAEELEFEPAQPVSGRTAVGVLRVPIGAGSKIGWVVDGQQRLAALRQMKRSDDFWVPVIGLVSEGVDDEREQFVLVNNSRPLPKSLVYELYPSLGDSIPPKMKKRQRAYRMLEILATNPNSPFYNRIRMTTARHLTTANIKDLSVLKMIENSMDNGVLARYPEGLKRPTTVLKNYWSAVARVFPEAWDFPPRKSRLTHGAGIVSMGYIMDTIAFRLAEEWESVPQHAFERELKKFAQNLPWTGGVWELSREIRLPWNEIQNTSRHIDILTNYLVRQYREVLAPKAEAKG